MIYIEIFYIIILSRVTDLLSRMLWDIYNSTTNTLQEIMEAVSDSYNIKEDLEGLEGVDRVMLFNAHTISKTKDLYEPIKVSSIWGNSKDAKKWRSEYNVDREYMRVLRSLSEDNHYIFETEKEEDSLLKAIYTKEGIKRSVIFLLKYKYRQRSLIGHILRLKGKREGFYYISIASKSGEKFSSKTEVGIRENLAKLSGILSYE